MMEDGSEADASLIMNPNDGVFLYAGPESSGKASFAIDARIVTEDSVTQVNLHVDCGAESSETIATVTNNTLGIEQLTFKSSN